LLAWLNISGCRELTGNQATLPLEQWGLDPRVRDHVRRSLTKWNAEHSAASQRIARVLLLADAPSIDANEITDKGYINQRVGLERRGPELERLYADPPDPGVLVLAMS